MLKYTQISQVENREPGGLKGPRKIEVLNEDRGSREGHTKGASTISPGWGNKKGEPGGGGGGLDGSEQSLQPH